MQSTKRQTVTKGSNLGGFIVLAVVAFLFYLGANAAYSFYEEVSTKVYEKQGR